MRTFASLLVAATLAAAGCGKSANEKTCERFVDLQIKCGEDPAMEDKEKDAMHLVVGGMCIAALERNTSGAEGEVKQMMLQMQESIRTEVACLGKATTCDEWQKCKKD